MEPPDMGAPLLSSSLNGLPCAIFLDTGSSCSLVSSWALKYFGLHPAITPANLTLKGLGGSLPVLGYAYLTLTLGSETSVTYL